MRRFQRLSCALVSGVAFMFSGVASAQEAPSPGEIVGVAAQAMGGVTSAAREAQRAVVQATLSRLEALDADGASDEALQRVALLGVGQVREIAGTARGGLNRIGFRAARALEAIEAPEAFFEALREVRGAAGERLRQTTGAATQTIRDALADLVDSEKTGVAA